MGHFLSIEMGDLTVSRSHLDRLGSPVIPSLECPNLLDVLILSVLI